MDELRHTHMEGHTHKKTWVIPVLPYLDLTLLYLHSVTYFKCKHFSFGTCNECFEISDDCPDSTNMLKTAIFGLVRVEWPK